MALMTCDKNDKFEISKWQMVNILHNRYVAITRWEIIWFQ